MSFPKMNINVTRRKGFENNSITVMEESVLFHNTHQHSLNVKKDIRERQIEEGKEKEYQNKLVYESIATNSIFENQKLRKLQSIEPGMKTIYFKKFIGDLVIESLVLDKDFVTKYESNIRHAVSEYVDDFGGYNKFLTLEQSSKSPLLNRIKLLCEKMAKKSCKRKLKEADESESVDSIDLSVSYEDEEDYENMKGELNAEKISELVKNKVITVIKDEKKREVKEKEVIENIKSELEENESEDEETDIEESLNLILSMQRNQNLTEGTLFYGLMHQTYKSVLESMDDDDDDYEDEDDDDLDDIFEEDDSDDDDDEDDCDSVEESSSNACTEINMDQILSEAILKYTLMETFYTLQLESYTVDDMRRITINLLNSPSNNLLTEGKIMDKVRKKLQDRYAKKILLSPKQVEKLDVEKQKERLTKMINDSKTVEDCDIYKKELLRDIGLKSLKQRYPDVSPELVKKALDYHKWLSVTAQSIIAKKRKELQSVKESMEILHEDSAFNLAFDLLKRMFNITDLSVYNITKATALETMLTNTSRLKSMAIKSLDKAKTKKACLKIKKRFSGLGEYLNIERKYEGEEEKFKKVIAKGKEFYNWVEKTFIPMIDKKMKSLDK